jgi:hypothetical protein
MAGQTITAVIAADAKPFKKGMQSAATSTSLLTGSLKTIAAVAAASMAAATAAVLGFVYSSLQAADESRKISNGLEQAVKNSKAFGKSSSNIAAVTEALGAASTKLGELAGIDDEVISGMKRNWLAVPKIAATGVAGINKLAQVAADVAAGTGKDLETVATAFTKAYGDPKGALAKLQKAGIVLTDTEKARYNALIKSGKETEALGFLADTLGKKFEGAAQAAASPFERLKVIWGNFQEDIGAAFLPILDQLLPDLQKAFKDLAVDPEFRKAIQELADQIKTTLPDLVKNLPSIVRLLGQAATAIVTITNAIGALPDWVHNNQWLASIFGLGVLDPNVKTSTPFQMGAPKAQNTNVTINVNSVSSSAETGRAVANALQSYIKSGGKMPYYQYVMKR